MAPAEQQVQPVGNKGIRSRFAYHSTENAGCRNLTPGMRCVKSGYCGSLSSTPLTYQFMPRIMPSSTVSTTVPSCLVIGPLEGIELASSDGGGGFSCHLGHVFRHVGVRAPWPRYPRPCHPRTGWTSMCHPSQPSPAHVVGCPVVNDGCQLRLGGKLDLVRGLAEAQLHLLFGHLQRCGRVGVLHHDVGTLCSTAPWRRQLPWPDQTRCWPR